MCIIRYSVYRVRNVSCAAGNKNICPKNFLLSTNILLIAGLTLLGLSALQNPITVEAAPGDIDSNFVTGTGFSSSIFSTQTQSDGKILVGGAFTTYNGTTANRIVRLEAIEPPAPQCGDTNTTQTAATANTSVCLEINAGVATLYAGDKNDNDDICTQGDDGFNVDGVNCTIDERSVDLSPATVLNVRQESTALVYDIVLDDLRGLAAAQYTVDVTMCDLVGDQTVPVTYALGYTGDGNAALFARSDADTAGVIEALKPGTTVTAYATEGGNWDKGADTQVTDTATAISVYSTTADVTPGRYDIDSVEIGFELPAYIEVGGYTCDITYTLVV
jgi:hypothetical protein